MASKLRTIRELAHATSAAILSPDEWTAFLRVVGQHYKYSYSDQLLIYAQRPEATALASIDTWNRQLHRWVNKGATGIALINDNNGAGRLDYVFDISDTNSRYAPTPKLWELRDEHHAPVAEALSNAYGTDNEHFISIDFSILEAAQSIVIENSQDYLAELLMMREGSSLMDVDADTISSSFKTLLIMSVTAAVLNRCKLDGVTEIVKIEVEDLANVSLFDTPATMALLGSAVSDLSEMALRTIERTVKAFDREHQFEPDRDAQPASIGRSESNERADRIPAGGRLPTPRLDTGEPSRANSGQIRPSAQEVSDGTPARDVQPPVVVRGAEQAPYDGGQGGQGDDGEANDRATRVESPSDDGGRDGVDRPSQLDTTASGGSNPERFDLRVGQQDEGAANEAAPLSLGESSWDRSEWISSIGELLSTSSITMDEVDAVLRDGGNYGNSSQNTMPYNSRSTLRIAARFAKDKTAQELTEYLRREYLQGPYNHPAHQSGKGFGFIGTSGARGHGVCAWYDETGIQLAVGVTAKNNIHRVTIPWDQAAARVNELMLAGQYVSLDTLRNALNNERSELANRLWDFYRDDMRGIPEEWNAEKGGHPEDVAIIRSLLDREDERQAILNRLETDVGTWNNTLDKRSWHNPHRLLADMHDAVLPPVFQPTDSSIPQKLFSYFITQDEIDALLTSGGTYSEGKFRIVSFFLSGHDDKEKLDYIKREYGHGGGTWSDTDGWHDAEPGKGLTLQRGRIGNPSAQVNLKWGVVAKRTEQLITSGHYMTRAELNYVPRYEQLTLVRQVNGFYYDVPVEYKRPFPGKFGYSYNEYRDENGEKALDFNYPHDAEWQAIRSFLDDTERIDAVLEDMQRVYADTSESDRHYSSRKTAYEALSAFREGTYTLFPGIEKLPDPETAARRLEQSLWTRRTPTVNVREPSETYSFKPVQASEQLSIFSFDLPILPTVGEQIERIGQSSRQDSDWISDELLEYAIEDLAADGIDNPTAEQISERAESILAADDPESDSTLPISEADIDSDAPDIDAESQEPTEIVTFESVDEPNEPDEALNDNGDVITPHYTVDDTNTVDLRSSSEISDINETTTIARNYRITSDSHIGEGSQRDRIINNFRAIRLVQSLESEDRSPTLDEQHLLARYVGWGGLPQVFDENNHLTMYETPRSELKTMLNASEYAAARASTLNAHYTSTEVIGAMYDALASLGFDGGSILEPSCGVGNFLGLLPESMRQSKLSGVELDSISGRIARQLYPEANIEINGFEETAFRDNAFDVVIGNVPFGDYKVSDKAFDRYNLRIHDYFLAKSIAKVRPGGVVALITSKGTMDKKSPDARRYIAQHAELLGAIRLPNNAFQRNAGTEVTTDILFLQKRDRPIEIEPDWCYLSTTDDGVPINNYFAENPQMMLGTMSWDSSMYGNEKETTLNPIAGAVLSEQLREAIQHLQGRYEAARTENARPYASGNAQGDTLDNALEEPFSPNMPGEPPAVIPADPGVRNYSYTIVRKSIYFRLDDEMHLARLSKTADNRVRGLIGIRDAVRKLIDLQLYGSAFADITSAQEELNALYDGYTASYGSLNSRGNSMAFSDDSSYPLLCSLEILDEEGQVERKADIFTKRTIRQHEPVTSVDTPAEALAVCLGERGQVDIPIMASLCGVEPEELITELSGVIFKNPLSDAGSLYEGWETADEYLSGNVRDKLRIAENAAETNPELFAPNADALRSVQPEDLEASEINVRLGTTWIPDSDIQDFMCDVLDISRRGNVHVSYYSGTSMWNIANKSAAWNIEVREKYGTNRMNGLHILEECLNLRDVRIFDIKIDPDGKEKRVFNRKETILAQQKQELLRSAFKDWIYSDRDRRERLVAYYNAHFNNARPRVFDGSHLIFPGMNPEIRLNPHQRNAVARVVYGGNSLLAHEVGSGKTFTMAAAAMELKRIGLAHKSMIVVPSHLTEQWAAEFLRLYPAANILTTTKKDFESSNRKKFCARIATGDYDAVIIGHSQFERIPISNARQKAQLEEQIDEIISGISHLKAQKGENFAVKQMEATRKRLQVKLKALENDEKKDDVITFDELGVDRLFVDESQEFKNLFTFTKMRNVAGITTSEAQKATDMYNKCRYMDGKTGGKGVIFASGTPISNTMSELFTVQRYLQYDALQQAGLSTFDAWASVFGETTTTLELAPEGTGYRPKTRFSRFHNLPELMQMYRQVADIQTAEMLDLPKPALKGGKITDVAVKPSEIQRELVAKLAERADAVRKGNVDAHIDNMLAITNDGRKLALDQRLLDPSAPDNPNSKINACIENVMRIWADGMDEKTTQLIFCDLSTPGAKSTIPMVLSADGSYKVDWDNYRFDNVYDDIRAKLIEKGIQPDEIAFIHDANTDAQKAELFARVRSGDVRILIGSTFKCGAGTNIQTRLKALHHCDAPWRPSDLQQRDGRILRQGNTNSEVEIFRYVTEGTFDAYSYQLLENKQRFISQVQTGRLASRSAEDIDSSALSYAEIKALAAGDVRIKQKMELDVQVDKLKLLKTAYLGQKYRLESAVTTEYPMREKVTGELVTAITADVDAHNIYLAAHPGDDFRITVNGVHYDKRPDAGEILLALCNAHLTAGNEGGKIIGNIHGFDIVTCESNSLSSPHVALKGAARYTVQLSGDPVGSIMRLENSLRSMPDSLAEKQQQLERVRHDSEQAHAELAKPFIYEQELTEKTARLAELNIMLNTDGKESEDLGDPDAEPEQGSNVMMEKVPRYASTR